MPSDAPADAPTPAGSADYRSLLEAEAAQLRAELAELGHGDAGGLEYDSNFADTSQVTAERGEAEALATRLGDSLEAVAEALERLDAGTYGSCLECGDPVDPARLEAMPATRYCIRHASRP